MHLPVTATDTLSACSHSSPEKQVFSSLLQIRKYALSGFKGSAGAPCTEWRGGLVSAQQITHTLGGNMVGLGVNWKSHSSVIDSFPELEIT